MAISDVDLVEAMRRRDEGAFTALYEAYADRVFSYCLAMLRDHDDAADATQETFLRTVQRLDQLNRPDRLGSWVFAIARNEVADHGRRRRRTVPVAELPRDPVVDEDAALELGRRELRELVWAAADGLSARDREVMALVGAGTTTADLAEAFGVDPAHARALASRMRIRLEQSVSALLLSRSGPRACPELARIVAAADGRFSVLVRKRIVRHAESCETCAAVRSSLAAPAHLAPATLLVTAPGVLRTKLLAASGTSAAVAAAPATLGLVPALLGRAAIVLGLVVGGGSAVTAGLDAGDADRHRPAPEVTAALEAPSPEVGGGVAAATNRGATGNAPRTGVLSPPVTSEPEAVLEGEDTSGRDATSAPPTEPSPTTTPTATVPTSLLDADLAVRAGLGGDLVAADVDAGVQLGSRGAAVDAHVDLSIVGGAAASVAATVDAAGGGGPLVGAQVDLGLVDLGLEIGGEGLLGLDLGLGSGGLLGLGG